MTKREILREQVRFHRNETTKILEEMMKLSSTREDKIEVLMLSNAYSTYVIDRKKSKFLQFVVDYHLDNGYKYSDVTYCGAVSIIEDNTHMVGLILEETGRTYEEEMDLLTDCFIDANCYTFNLDW